MLINVRFNPLGVNAVNNLGTSCFRLDTGHSLRNLSVKYYFSG